MDTLVSTVYFVVPWYPEQPRGGAEVLAQRTVHNLRRNGVDARVLTTCIPDFRADWAVNTFPQGSATVHGIPVERFPADSRDWRLFDQVNLRIMRGESVTEVEAAIYVEEGIRSRAIEARVAQLPADARVLYMPYLFGTTYWGMKIRPGWLLPCLHNEDYAHLSPFRAMFAASEGILCNARPESDLVMEMFNIPRERVFSIGTGVETQPQGNPARFRERFKIDAPFMVHVGRKDHGKNVDGLISDYAAFARNQAGSCKLILIGPGTVPIDQSMAHQIIDLGYLSDQDKRDAVAAAEVLCVPSINESFSFVLMEAWLLNTVVLVNARCPVTSDHVRAAAGGLEYDGAAEFAESLRWILNHPHEARRMAANGGNYVRRNFDWNIIVARLRRALAI